MSEPVRVLIQVQNQASASIEITLPEELVGEFMSDVALLCECYCDDDDECCGHDNCDCCDECCDSDEEDGSNFTGCTCESGTLETTEAAAAADSAVVVEELKV